MSERLSLPICKEQGPYKNLECICAAGCLVYGVEGVCLNPNCEGPVKPEECDPPHYSPCFADNLNEYNLDAKPDELGLSDDDDIPYGF